MDFFLVKELVLLPYSCALQAVHILYNAKIVFLDHLPTLCNNI